MARNTPRYQINIDPKRKPGSIIAQSPPRLSGYMIKALQDMQRAEQAKPSVSLEQRRSF